MEHSQQSTEPTGRNLKIRPAKTNSERSVLNMLEQMLSWDKGTFYEAEAEILKEEGKKHD